MGKIIRMMKNYIGLFEDNDEQDIRTDNDDIDVARHAHDVNPEEMFDQEGKKYLPDVRVLGLCPSCGLEGFLTLDPRVGEAICDDCIALISSEKEPMRQEPELEETPNVTFEKKDKNNMKNYVPLFEEYQESGWEILGHEEEGQNAQEAPAECELCGEAGEQLTYDPIIEQWVCPACAERISIRRAEHPDEVKYGYEPHDKGYVQGEDDSNDFDSIESERFEEKKIPWFIKMKKGKKSDKKSDKKEDKKDCKK